MSGEDSEYPINVERVSDEVWHPKLKLFLSADIVGSTPLKQRFDFKNATSKSSSEYGAWLDVIQSFYTKLNNAFLIEAWSEACSDMRLCYPSSVEHEETDQFLGSAPTLWKTIGDEAIFTKDVTGDLQPWFTIAAWLKGTKNVQEWLKAQGELLGFKLDVKCTAWVANFPVKNAIIFKPGSDIGMRAKDQDYIGPGIDVGFRLTQWASRNTFPVSMDLAYVLAKTEQDDDWRSKLEGIRNGALPGVILQDQFKKIDVRFSGTGELKGVFGGAPYPKFIIDLSIDGSLDAAEFKMMPNPYEELSCLQIIDYCQKYYDHHSQYASPPFINRDHSVLKDKVPASYQELYNSMPFAQRSEASAP